ncbi:MAG: LysM peptidoglycan-binding domain-containing protein [Desulfobacteraceae bacterium]|nr:LysM peptidoglycan-binding domain-containing protein [Desulfobacteraceae bacterium]MBC2754078.1 LysM peptidoglycan-binding domain-containing protein [Desulfobacteraceae bacterium]
MKSKLDVFAFQLVLIVTGCLIMSMSIYGSADGAFLQKQFVVCQDQGRDVLCDSYVVKKDDYVTKLFKQRGEIAYRDFPMFLEIFKRLNPSVKNIDLIFPNQRILVPLRLIAPDTLEGQATGTVTIPLITITNIPRQLQQNSMNYVVQQGDCVSALIAKKFGRYSTRPYKEALKIFKYLNPQIKDLNLIHVGQPINIPVPTVRDEFWYPELFDEAGELVVAEETVDEVREEKPVEVIEETVEAAEAAEVVDVPVIEKIPAETVQAPEPPVEEKIKEEKSVEEKPVEEKPGKLPVPEPLTPLPSIFKKAAAIFGAELLDTGEYFFPRQGREDLTLDLAATPVMEFKSGMRILFAKKKSLSSVDQGVVVSFWKNLQIVTMSYDALLRELLYTICQLIDKNGCENNFSINDWGLTATIRGELIYDNINGPGKVCIFLIDHPGQKMSDDLHHYLSDKQFVVSEWIDGEDFFGPVSVGNAGKPLPGNFITPDTSHPAAFIKDFAAAFGLRYQENVEITFPYAEFQVKAYSNMLSVSPGKEFLVDFGDLQGDAIESIEATGFQVLQISPGQSCQSIVSDLLRVMPAQQSEDPVLWGADRARTYNASIQVPGRLITILNDRGKMKLLITDITPHDNILSFLNRAGIRIMKINNN